MRKKTEEIKIRVTADEKRKIKELAAANNQTVSSFISNSVLKKTIPLSLKAKTLISNNLQTITNKYPNDKETTDACNNIYNYLEDIYGNSKNHR